MRTIILLLIMFFPFTQMSYAHVMTDSDYWEYVERETQILKNNPNDSEAYCIRGDYYASLRMDDQAMADLSKAIFINLRQAYKSKDLAYENSYKYIKEMGDSYLAIARVYKGQGNIDKVIENYTKAIEVYSHRKPEDANHFRVGYANVLTDRAHIYIKQGKYDLALADLTTAINAFDHNFYVKERAELYYLMGEYEKSIQDYNRAMIYNEYWAGSISQRGDAYAKKGDYSKALEDYNTALQFGSSPSTLMSRASVYVHEKQPRRAIADYSAAIDCLEENAYCAQAYYLRGKLFFEQDEYDRALTDCDKAIELKSDCIEAQQLRDKIIAQLKRNKN